ncbi:helix-turn-helix domain-containing protein [Thermomonospora cellulosilytica]|uniref:Transcriptional regulator with XRE-family HTH domain n=1 Tax=Thermomonospora cellulosilytica TaxID=1411118 RepID=A0A7W3MTR1_9ACTN|nr:helix-turn-helix transcriptional regulator [Thermomonospora cellulosilytica]MBA9001689.1 transcriptional regulator with XRE-family HTH domain [Thermomonospora cellulosilytica]
MWNLIAYYLRFCRVQRGLSGEDLGKIIGASKPTVSRIENGTKRLDETDASKIDRAWNTGGLFAFMVWYATLGHDPEWFQEYVKYEQRAEVMRIFEANTVPGLLQTEDYARAVLEGGMHPNPMELFRERMARQGILNADRETPPHLVVLLSQAVLDWPIGGVDVLREQLAHLLEMAERPHITINVLPRTAGAHPGVDGSFSIMSGDFGDVAYTVSPGGGRLVSAPSDVRRYALRFDRISAKALPEGPSLDLIKQTMEAMT